MTSIKRGLAALGLATLVTGGLSACGGGVPADASVKDYCAAVNNASDDKAFEKLSDGDWDGFADLLKESAEKIEEVGTPKGISDDAREGFEIQLDAIDDLSAGDLKKAFEGDDASGDPFKDKLSKDEQAKIEKYQAYEDKTCDDE